MVAMVVLTFFSTSKNYTFTSCLSIFIHSSHIQKRKTVVICFQTETERRLSSRLLSVGGTV